jgi:hypothetical protein
VTAKELPAKDGYYAVFFASDPVVHARYFYADDGEFEGLTDDQPDAWHHLPHPPRMRKKED